MKRLDVKKAADSGRAVYAEFRKSGRTGNDILAGDACSCRLSQCDIFSDGTDSRKHVPGISWTFQTKEGELCVGGNIGDGASPFWAVSADGAM
jgi:hypothetical protein